MTGSPGHQQFDAASQLFNMDPTQAAKQMAALNAAGQARMATNSRGPSSSGTNSGAYLGGMNSATYPTANHDLMNANFQIPNNHPMASASNSVVNTSFLDPTMAQPNAAPTPAQAAMQLRQRQQVFLSGLANVMAKRNTPLPPALTGVAVPNYDPTNSPWKAVEPSSEMGAFRLAGKDVNLFKLWGLVQYHGGGHAITNKNGWGIIAAQFDLPEDLPQPQATGLTSVANMLCQYYMAILYPFEELYKRNMNMPEHQRRMQMASRPSGAPFQGQAAGGAAMQGRPIQGMHGMAQPGATAQAQRPGGNHIAPMHAPVNPAAPPPQAPHAPITPTQRPSTTGFNTPSGPPGVNSLALTDTVPPLPHQDAALELGENVLDQDFQGIKRKMEFEDGNNKRARQKTEPLENNSISPASVNPASSTEPSQKPASTSIVAQSGQPMRRKIEYVPLGREVDTYGARDLKAIEAEYANVAIRPLRDVNDWGIVDIEALTMSLRSRLAPELSYALTTLTLLSTMRGQSQGTGFPIIQCLDLFEEILDLLEETAFGGTQDTPSASSDDDGVFLTNRELVNRIIEDEGGPFATLRVAQGDKELQFGPRQRPATLILVISNLLRNFSLIFDNAKYMSQHKRVLLILFRLCSTTRNEHGIRSASPALSPSDLVALKKDVLFTLVNVAPYTELAPNGQSSSVSLIAARRAFDLLASYLVDPSEAISLYALVQLNGSLKPPSLADAALEVFTKISQTDSNRQVIAQAVSQASIRRLFESLVHRLPVADADFQLLVRESWVCYVEKTLMAIYSLAFLAPPSLKQSMKKDRNLGFKGVMLRMIRKFLWFPEPKTLMVAARRAIEAMKMIDDGEDTFDTGQSTTPTLAFGMGYGEAGESGTERGTGLLGGQREMAWEMLMHREVLSDVVMFGELESLSRVECP